MLNDVPVEVIGVMPEGFRLPTDFTQDAAEPTQLWRPLRLGPGNLNRTDHTFYAAAVLAPGQTPETATAELQAITQRLTEQGAYPPQMQFTAFAVGLDQEIRGELRPAMWLLMGAVGFLLLIACVNVANLLLVRGDARVREMAVRTAIGASPTRLVRQLFTESVVLAIAGAVLGLGLAAVALRVLTSVDPTSLPPLAPVRLDLTVIALHAAAGRRDDPALRAGAGVADAARRPRRITARRRPARHRGHATAAAARRPRRRRSGPGGRARHRRRVDDPDARGAGRHRSRLQPRSRPDDAGDDSGVEVPTRNENVVNFFDELQRAGERAAGR